jgi:hypothetical protein
MKARLDPDVLHTALGNGEAVLVQSRTARFYSLNVTAARVWSLLCDGASLEEVSRDLERGYDVTAPGALVHVQRLAAELEREGLIRLEPDAPESAA